MRQKAFSAVLVLVFASACAKHAPEPVPHPNSPHISWSLGVGSGEEETCKSTTTSPCTIELRRDRPSTSATFHVFLHSVDNADIKYSGAVRVGFLMSPAREGAEHRVDQTVKAGSAPVNESTTGIVRPAGTYYVEITLSASPAGGSGQTLPIKTRVPVSVR
ncbi:MAG: hypothetical protein DMF84_24670 [Acidobacteria bacterium]|nr:MAG: hypothetical protein DMF84_24670 [Acidobacteriota bacterium]